MKNNKIFIIVVILVAVLASTITAYATTYLYNSSEVSYDNTNSGLSATNVQGAISELYDNAIDYNSMNARLNSYFQNSPTSYFDANYLLLGKNSTSTAAGLHIYNNSKDRASLYYYSGDDTTVLTARNSSEENGKGILDIKGNPVKINGNYAMFNTYASSTDDLNTIFDNQPDRTVYLIGAQGEANQAISNGTALHFVISYRATSGWGAQYEFNSGRIFYRSKGNGTWGAWTQKL